MSLGIGMCPQSQWEKVAKGSWAQSMSPFDHKLIDIRTSGLSLESFEVSIEEGMCIYTVNCKRKTKWEKFDINLICLWKKIDSKPPPPYCRILYVPHNFFNPGLGVDEFGLHSWQVIGILLWKCYDNWSSPCSVNDPFSGN